MFVLLPQASHRQVKEVELLAPGQPIELPAIADSGRVAHSVCERDDAPVRLPLVLLQRWRQLALFDHVDVELQVATLARRASDRVSPRDVLVAYVKA